MQNQGNNADTFKDKNIGTFKDKNVDNFNDKTLSGTYTVCFSKTWRQRRRPGGRGKE